MFEDCSDCGCTRSVLVGIATSGLELIIGVLLVLALGELLLHCDVVRSRPSILEELSLSSSDNFNLFSDDDEEDTIISGGRGRDSSDCDVEYDCRFEGVTTSLVELVDDNSGAETEKRLGMRFLS